MIDDPLFYLVAVPAVLLYGLGKGGLGAAPAENARYVDSRIESALDAAD